MFPAVWLFLALAATAPAGAAAPAEDRVVVQCALSGTVDAGSAEYLRACVTDAEQRGAEALLVTVDTPGGALESTREIVQSFLGAQVPVLVWVGPSGARAGSAGVFVTLAANVAAMAPGTNIGAAHPVSGPTGADPEAGGEHLARKVENDAVAFVEAIANQRGRNAQWARDAVKESASVAADEAKALGVVDLIAPSVDALLEAAEGREVTTAEGTRALRTADAALVELEPNLRQRVVHWLANPSLAYLLFLVAMLGITFEVANPGMILPGAIGVSALVLALVAFSALPIQAGAVALLVLGVALIVAELFVTSGALAVVGVLLLAAGGVLLVDRFDPSWFVEPSFHLSLRVLLPTVLALGGMTAWIVMKAAAARREPQRGGDVGMVGERGRALTEISSAGGEVFAHGERWQAVAEKPVKKDARVVVREVEGLTLRVEEVPA